MREIDNEELPRGVIRVYNYSEKKSYKVERNFHAKPIIAIALVLSLLAGVKITIANRNKAIREHLDASYVQDVKDSFTNLSEYYGKEEENAFGSLWAYKNYVKAENPNYDMPNNGVTIPNIIDEDNPLLKKIKELEDTLNTTTFPSETYRTVQGQSKRQVAEDVLPYPGEALETADPVTKARIKAAMNELYDQFLKEMEGLNGWENGFLPLGDIRIPSTEEYSIKVERAVDECFLQGPDDGLEYYSSTYGSMHM